MPEYLVTFSNGHKYRINADNAKEAADTMRAWEADRLRNHRDETKADFTKVAPKPTVKEI